MDGLLIRIADGVDAGQREGAVDDVGVARGGARLVARFPAPAAPRLRLGSVVAVEVSGAPLPRPVTVRGRVRARATDTLFERVTILLDERARAVLLPQVSRRVAVRVRPSAVEPVELTILPPRGDASSARCRDVSIVGVAAVVHVADDAELFALDRLGLELRLPGDTGLIQLEARVRQRKLAGLHALYGLEFLLDDSREHEALRDRLHAYVMRRQREMLRAAARPPGDDSLRDAS